MNNPNRKPHVIILGGGFGGLACAKKLVGEHCRVTLIDRNNHHLFQPLLYQVATSGLSQPEIAKPIRGELPMDRNIRVLMDEVTKIDLDNKEVICREHRYVYDYLIIGLGATNGYFGNDHWAEHTVGLKSLEEAAQIRRQVLHAYERAEMEEDIQEQKRLMTTVVVGGGPTGVEMAGALVELGRHVLDKDFTHIDPAECHVILIEASPKILGQFSDPLPKKAERALRDMGVDVRTNSPVKDISAGCVELEDKKIIAETIIWAAGVQAPALTRTLGVPVDRGGRFLIEGDCSLPGHPEVFAIGDIVSLTDARNVKVPGVSPAAIQMGGYVADIINQEIEEGQRVKRTSFAYFDKGSMATIGRSKAVAQLGPLKFDGIIAWFLWLAVHLVFLVGFRNKILVLVQWGYAYVRYKHGARIITGLTQPQNA
ncbi:MAG: NAD(P)/FAD-dependent oxidoreductase [Verrucomicrobiota bacterium]